MYIHVQNLTKLVRFWTRMCILLGMYHWGPWIQGSFYLMKHSWKHTFTYFVYASPVLQCFVLVSGSITFISLVGNKICQNTAYMGLSLCDKNRNPFKSTACNFLYLVRNQLLKLRETNYTAFADIINSWKLKMIHLDPFITPFDMTRYYKQHCNK